MGILANPKHEKFAQGLAKGLTQEEAYAQAGYKPDRGNASHLTADHNVQARVAELQGRAAENVVATREWVLERLILNVERAMQHEEITQQGKPTGEYKYEGSVANRALELLGKEIGMFVDRKEVRTGELDDLSADERSRLRAAIERELATRSEGDREAGQPKSAGEVSTLQ